MNRSRSLYWLAVQVAAIGAGIFAGQWLWAIISS
jgi:hypothetical protein